MALPSLFVAPIVIRRTKPAIHPPTHVRLYPALPRASVAPPTPHNPVTPPNLAQAARLVTSAVPLTSFATPLLVNPLYIPEIVATFPANFPIIRALGLAVLSPAIVLYAHRSHARPVRLANVIAFATTAALYLANPIKPPVVNIPFVAALLLIAFANAFSLFRSPKSHETTTWRLAPIVKVTAAAAVLVAAISSRVLLSRVYLLQISLNLAVAACVALRAPRITRVFGAADSFALLGLAACLRSFGPLYATVGVVAAALSAGWDAALRADA